MPGVLCKTRGKVWLLVLPPQAPEGLRTRIEKAVAAQHARRTRKAGFETLSRHGLGFKAMWSRVSSYNSVYKFFFTCFAKAKPRMTATFQWSIAPGKGSFFEGGKQGGIAAGKAVAKAISKKTSKRLPRPSPKKRPAAIAAHKDASKAGHAVARADSAKRPRLALAAHQGSAEAGHRTSVIAEPRAATTLPLREGRPVLAVLPPLSSHVARPTSCAPSRAALSVAPEVASASDDLLLKMMSLRRRHPDMVEAMFHNTYNVLGIGTGRIVRGSAGDVFFTLNPAAEAVAIKTWQADHWEAVLTEVTMMQRCRHPHIVPLLDTFVGRAFRLVCVDGGDDLEVHMGRGCQGESWTLPRKASLLLTIENMSRESIYYS